MAPESFEQAMNIKQVSWGLAVDSGPLLPLKTSKSKLKIYKKGCISKLLLPF